MATNQPLHSNRRSAQLTYTNTITGAGATTVQFPLPAGTIAYTLCYVLAGAGSLQMQESANDPGEVLNQSSASGIPQVWVNIGTASTGGTAQKVEGAGSPTMLRGTITGGSGTDVLTICINASYAS